MHGRLPGLLPALLGTGSLVLPLVPFADGRLAVRLELRRRFAGRSFGTVALVGRRLLPAAFAGAIALASSPAAATLVMLGPTLRKTFVEPVGMTRSSSCSNLAANHSLRGIRARPALFESLP